MRRLLMATLGTAALAFAAPAFAQSGTAETYLKTALEAVQQHHAMKAISALDRAEAEMIDSSAPASRADSPDDSPAIRQMARAREAVQSHKWSQATDYINEAMKHPSTTEAK